MNRISGRVVLRDSGAGIPDLLVAVYDLDPETKPEESLSPSTGGNAVPDPPGGDAIGTVLTGKDGSFELIYEDAEFQVRNPKELRPDLLLQVLAPEEPGRPVESRVLFVTPSVRQNAGRTEQYLIRLTAAQLTKAGIDPPSIVSADAEPAKGRVQRLKDAGVRSSAIIDGTIKVARTRVDEHRARFTGFVEKLQPALTAALSSVPANVLQPERLVAKGDSPFAKNSSVILTNLREVINSDDPAKRAPVRGFISLTQGEAAELQAQVGADGTVPEEAIRAVAARNGAETQTTFLQRSDALPLCRPKTAADATTSEILTGQPPGNGPVPPPAVPGPGIESITSDDIPRFVARLLNPLTAPEELLVTGLTPAATRDSVQQSVNDLTFQPSPADVPAFHDFNQIQIAFQHVWQELTDRGVLDLAQDAYETIVELGGDPHRPEYGNVHPFDVLQFEARTAMRAMRLTPPPIVRDHRGDPTDPATAPGGVVVTTTPGGVVVRDHRGGGGAVTVSDPEVRLPALLQELDTRLRQKYSFTIFAANAQERSVNFGILNTFRQVWTPLSYQAGALVKSIPLAPKQTQKVVITRKVTKKRVQKEVENNLRILKEETSETSRAEQEIARRASIKSEFSYSNSASGTIDGVASESSTTSFKLDAAKSSDDVKKSFHESVFKAAQEFKNERTTEISTESLEELDTTETTEISNPNDEIAVTFLFYELQRRYRLHERLFRVTPVVLVAQEVPAPNVIDEAWLITYDWILKRVILDDSFLPTLETLCQSAGNETALTQLAANVTQQRQIVAQLRAELAVARNIVAVQNGLTHEAVARHSDSSGLLGSIVGGIGSAVEGAVGSVSHLLFGGSPDANMSNQQALKNSADAAADTARDLTFRLEREVTALNAITETYAKALQAHHTHLAEIARLCIHVKENILYYMQAIWRHEPPDQRFFRLHNVPIPTLKKQRRRIRIGFNDALPVSTASPHLALPRFGGRSSTVFPTEAFCQFPEQLEYLPLCEVADLDNLLGFKGNYMLFPLHESNPLTDFMMEPYVDRATGELVDPSDPSGWSLDEFSNYVVCLRGQLTTDEFEALKPTLKQQYEALLTAPRREDDVLVVPTNSLFIEALPAEHSLIETFKRNHRMIDVKMAQAKVREEELEAVRKAARLLANEREDPNIDQRVLIEGAVPGVVVPPPA